MATDSTKQSEIPRASVQRLSLYLRRLEFFREQGHETVSSDKLGEALEISPAQVRKDLAYFGQFGQPGIGYKVEDLVAKVRQILGTDHRTPVVLVGAGNLGRALIRHRGFARKGFDIVAALDADESLVGKSLGSGLIQPVDKLEQIVAEQDVQIALLCVPVESAQSVANQAVAAGIRGILNFAPVTIKVPEHVHLCAVDLAIELEQLSFRLHQDEQHPPLADAADDSVVSTVQSSP